MLFIAQYLLAQNHTITFQQDSVTFTEVIKHLKKETTYHFFYNPQWVDSLVIDVRYNQSSLTDVLNDLCQYRSLKYTIIENNNVIFTQKYPIKTNYGESYIHYLTRRNDVVLDTIEYVPFMTKEEDDRTSNPEYQLFKIGNPSAVSNTKTATLSGTLKDMNTGEPLIGAVVYIDKLKGGAVTNVFGYYAVSVPKGQYKIEYRSVGMGTTYRNVMIYEDGKVDVNMQSEPTSIGEVTVVAQSDDFVKNLSMGVEKLSIKAMKQLPMGFGEADVMKTALLLPGIQTVGEASSGFNVRGGSTDQNLILLNEASIINTSHFFGFFSGFNPDLVKDITIYKSGVPAKYGGRVSSVMDITLKEGNRKKLKIAGGISPVFGRIAVEAPIVKDKSSFAFGARTTYSDWVLKLLDDRKLNKSDAEFYDLQGSLSYDIDQNNSLYLSGYYSHDKFDYYSEDAFKYNTLASTLTWKHIFNPKLYATFSGVMSNYDYLTAFREDSSLFNSVSYDLNQTSLKTDFNYHSSKNHKINFGLNALLYNLSPGTQQPIGELSTIKYKKLEEEQALENSLYVSDDFRLTPLISFSLGLRFSFFSNFGPNTSYEYQSGQPKRTETIIDTTYYGKGELFNAYSGLDYRFSSNIRLSENSSVKIGFSRMYQYIQMISNTTSMSPTDIWKLSDEYLKPQYGDQYAVGFYHKLRSSTIEASLEGYYKDLHNVLDYKDGADLLMNEHLETDVLNGKGKAYGVELMFEKKKGKLTGWVNYTYSRVLHKIDGEFDEERVNGGDYFSADYDKPHDFKIVGNYKFSRRVNLSSNFFYSTGRPYTQPLAYYYLSGSYRVLYGDRNSVRMDDYMRWDIALNWNGNLIKKKLNHSSWTFSLYNVLGRKNPYSVYFKVEDGEVKGYQMSIFAQPIFTVTYSFKFLGNASDDL
jgi:hypothetical protein